MRWHGVVKNPDERGVISSTFLEPGRRRYSPTENELWILFLAGTCHFPFEYLLLPLIYPLPPLMMKSSWRRQYLRLSLTSTPCWLQSITISSFLPCFLCSAPEELRASYFNAHCKASQVGFWQLSLIPPHTNLQAAAFSADLACFYIPCRHSDGC